MSAALKWTHIQSSNVEAIAHDGQSKTLAVRFNKGGLYVYHGVDENHYEELLNAPSVGEYLNRTIKLTCGYDRCADEGEVSAYFSSV